MWAVGASRWGRLPQQEERRLQTTESPTLESVVSVTLSNRYPADHRLWWSARRQSLSVPLYATVRFPRRPHRPQSRPSAPSSAEAYPCCPSQPGITTAALYHASGRVPRTARQVLRTMALKLIHKEFLHLAGDS
ncbi:PREDICTED: uncharacterized protein LOC105533017 [Mandrillus leucophaeus]|uniref:uncharacterized protein LOC105533017 n=1 Tax=Mandrillus leucophaeus TaxID=9568 RepID=UPI0005F38EA5|nr:PREDICTED: uncharacterized protein LOC105533017 [Mandrillus leucophaeus]